MKANPNAISNIMSCAVVLFIYVDTKFYVAASYQNVKNILESPSCGRVLLFLSFVIKFSLYNTKKNSKKKSINFNQFDCEHCYKDIVDSCCGVLHMTFYIRKNWK